MSPAIEIQNLSLGFIARGVISMVLRDVSLRVGAGEIVGLVGESGSGKSSLALALSRLLPDQSVDMSGRLTVYGRDVMALRGADLQRWRGSEVAVVFQEPMNALNPSLTIGRQLGDVIRIHQRLSPEKASTEAVRLLQVLCIEDPARVLACHPNMLSGGMRQRVLIAMALACKPKVLIADEPTTALDVSVQAEVLQILREQAAVLDMAVLLISHDLTLVRQFCQRVYVLHRGLVVESGSTDRVLRAPVHPYTRSLLEALPNRHAPRSRIFAPSAAEVVNGGGA